MRTIAGPNTNALRSITGYNVGSPLRKMPELTQGQAGSAAAGAAALGSDIGAIAGDQIPAQSAKGEGGRILGETAKYAGMGMAFGPIGAGVGALIGLTVGLVKNKKAKDAHKAQVAENKEIENAGKAQAALAANVNSQKQANNEQMANTKPGITRTLSSLGYSSSIKKQSSMEYNKSEMMRTLSGASSLKREEEKKEDKPKDKIITVDGKNYTQKPDGTVTKQGSYVGHMGEDGEIKT